jgi:hypothetical protein
MRLGLGFLRPAGGGGLYSPGAAATPTVGWQRSDGAGGRASTAVVPRRGPLIVPLPGRPISRVVPRAVPRAEFEAQALARAGH